MEPTFGAMRKFLLLLALLGLVEARAQEPGPTRDLVQFSGVVVSGDSLLPVPFYALGWLSRPSSPRPEA